MYCVTLRSDHDLKVTVNNNNNIDAIYVLYVIIGLQSLLCIIEAGYFLGENKISGNFCNMHFLEDFFFCECNV